MLLIFILEFITDMKINPNIGLETSTVKNFIQYKISAPDMILVTMIQIMWILSAVEFSKILEDFIKK